MRVLWLARKDLQTCRSFFCVVVEETSSKFYIFAEINNCMKKVNKDPEVLSKFGWTSVLENLPGILEVVLVLNSVGGMCVGYYGLNFKNDKITWYDCDGNNVEGKVVGWRRLPQIPFK